MRNHKKAPKQTNFGDVPVSDVRKITRDFSTFFRPPMVKVHDKVMIPQEEHPEINFVGLLIGPRGNTLKGKLIFRHHLSKCSVKVDCFASWLFENSGLDSRQGCRGEL
jgi:hypothetical protein